jgi:hypothetical protein
MGTPQGITLSETAHAFTFLISEDSDGAGYLSRDEVLIAAGQNFAVGQVLGKQAIVASVAELVTPGTNVGTGALTLASPAVDMQVNGGNYKILFTDPTHFLVQDPDLRDVAEGVVGTAFATKLHFTIAAGGTAFVAGDSFVINVDETLLSEQFVAWTPGATDGSQKAAAIAGFPVNTTNGVAANTTVINAHATVRLADVTFASGATQAQIDQAIRELGANLIKFR